MSTVEPAPAPRRVLALPPWLRATSATLQLAAAANLARLAALVVYDITAGAETAPPPVVVQGLALFSLVPLLLSWLALASARAAVSIDNDHVMIERPGERFEIPRASIIAVRPWRLPLPRPGLALRLASGRAFRLRLAALDPAPLAAAVDEKSTTQPLHPMLRWAAARAPFARFRPARLALKYLAFPLLPALILFRLYQLITFGGAFGEYHRFGLATYIRTFLLYYLGTIAHLILWAGAFRLTGELLAYAAAWLLPSRARPIRLTVEWTCRLAYWLGVPALMTLRLAL